MIKRKYEIIVLLGFVLITFFIFRNYFLKNTVPFPANLLVSFYQPYVSYIPPVANKPMGFDNLRIYYPMRELAVKQIKQGKLPLWNPYNFSGNTLLATYQSAIFNPLSPLFLILPIIDAWSIIIIVLPIFASLFTYLFLKDIGVSRKGSTLGAIAFAFSGYSIVWWEESFTSTSSALFLPLALLGINRIFKNDKRKGFLLLVISLTSSVLSGWFQITLYVFLFSIIWAVFLLLSSYRKEIKSFYLIILSFLLSLLISGIHLIPSIEAYLHSARGNTDAKYIFDLYFLKTSDFVRILFPDFYGNPGTYNYFSKGFYYETTFFIAVPAFILALYALFSFVRSRKIARFFSISFIVCFSLAFSLPASWFLLYELNVPIISTILPSRILFLSTFSLCVLAAFGLDYYLKKPEWKKLSLIVVFIASLTIYLYNTTSQELNLIENIPINSLQRLYLTTSIRNLILPAALAFATAVVLFFYLLFRRWSNLIFAAILVLSLLNIFYFTSKYLYFSEKKFVYPQVPAIKELKKVSGLNRVWGFKNARIENNFATYYELYSPEGYDSIYIKRYGELFHAAKQKGVYSEQIPRTDANLVTNDYEEGIDRNLYRKKIIQLLAVRYFLEHKDDVGEHKDTTVYKSVWNDDIFTIFEYTDAFPRTFFVDDYKVVEDPNKMIKVFFDSKTNLRKTMLLEENPQIKLDETELISSAKIVDYRPNKVVIDAETNKSALLFLSDAYFPGWNAYINGVPAKTYRADFAFRAVEVPKGKHSVEFIYQPNQLRYGATLTGTGIFLTIIMFLLIKKDRKLYG